MSIITNNSNAAGKSHAPGVLCLIVGLKSPWVTENNGKVAVLDALMLPGSSRICSCNSESMWGRLDTVNFGKCWRVVGLDLICSLDGRVAYTTIPQRNLIPIGTEQMATELQAELIKQQTIDLGLAVIKELEKLKAKLNKG